ncbi:MAG: AI-2E family transporter [Geminicoccaceae bacterium]|nr:AI-2E family transporter [Geminicoccaceae bacterium]
MSTTRKVWTWTIALIVFLLLLYVLNDVLLPFVAGLVVAYLLDPLADRLEAMGTSRTWATALLTVGFLLVVLGGVVLLVPVIESQASALAQAFPQAIDSIWSSAKPLIEGLRERFDIAGDEELQQALTSNAGSAAGWAKNILGGLLTGGMAIVNIVSLLFITPVVSFYLVRDWDSMIETVDGWLPRDHRDTIRQLLGEIDSSIAGFLRGQVSVCVILGLFYGIGLAVIGLSGGLLVGLLAGLLSFIPYVGSITGFVASMGLAAVQFGPTNFLMLGLTAGIFFVGQAVEGNFLTPKLVGDRIGLHPVWVIFALLAGGALFGFLGVMLAVPVAAAIGVLVRFGLRQYLASPLYKGHPLDKAD